MRTIRLPFGQVIALVLLTFCQVQAAIVADSFTEFSETQGQDNWFYGYYPGVLAPSSFLQMGTFSPVGRPNTWVVDDDLPSPIYYTILNAEGGHPNGVDAGRDDVLQYAVRRWISEVSGAITIAGNIADMDTGFGANGIIGKIFSNNLEVYSQSIDEADFLGVNYSLTFTVLAGDTIDFVIDPQGVNDLFDSTRFTATIFNGEGSISVPEPTSIMLLAAGCVVAFGRSRRHLLSSRPTSF